MMPSTQTGARCAAFWPVLLLAGCLSAQTDAQSRSAALPTLYYAGGVQGVADLADPARSQRYRAAGGGLYLHSWAWYFKLNDAQRRQILEAFRGAPVGIEIGFKGDDAAAAEVARQIKKYYLDLGVRPAFMASNVFNKRDREQFTLEEWRNFQATLRRLGVPASTPIMPTFEYQNGKKLDILQRNKVSESALFQALVKTGGGIVLDTPPGFALQQDEIYRLWVVDAIRWTQGQGLPAILIVSPHHSGTQWVRDTRQYLDYLDQHRAMPTAFVCENYNPKPPAGYPNGVGEEGDPNTDLGMCWNLMKNRTAPGRP
ncbi:hypothetical protein SAMN02949497_4362 [Methylomagnum ishizawai]|uniref:Uncharacterized protein n=1 Tax=Methylomagnum ishizawai TaxID=1760988 RepID=A0A1Y6D1Y1_9GAMM|nr:hypothetical protein [Methylomagnum ishizawai]SMF96948.1 hypothetical protein SAMN02949497_4362 [Methylomagnum ishizawai]